MNRTTVLITAILFLPVAAAHATTRYVAPGSSIQSAILASGPGDEVVVLPGVYPEAIDLAGRAITLRSSAGAADTTIDATGLETSAVTVASGEGPDTVIRGFTITGGIGTITGGHRLGGGMLILNASPSVDQCVFIGNSAYAGGGVQSKVAWPTITNCVFEENTANGLGDFGGGGLHVSLGGPVVRNCIFRNNSAVNGANGGGIGILAGDVEILNCLFTGNQAYTGGAMRNNSGRPVISNCTVTGNVAVNAGGGLRSLITSNNPVTITNSVFWGNEATSGPEIDEQGWSLTTVEHSLVRYGWNGAGSSNLGEDLVADDPQFIDDVGHVSGTSPCIDAGNDVVPAGIDLDGNDRLVGATVDIGAYEVQKPTFPCPGDLDGSGQVAFADLNTLLSNWGICTPGLPCSSDITNDGIVGFNDLTAILQSWGACP